MRFKVCMINDHGNFHEETINANIDKEEKMNVQAFNPKSKVLESTRVYK